MSAQESKKVLKPESLLKKDSKLLSSEELSNVKIEKKEQFKEKRRLLFKRVKKYYGEYKATKNLFASQSRQASAAGNFFVPSQPKLAFVIRTKGINKLAPKPRKILQLLRLLQINNGVFVKLTKATKQMLQLVEPFVTYGEPSLKAVKHLLYKRGYGKISGQRIRLTDNSLIERTLGKFGLLCVEDILHEIITVGPHFKQVNNFLWPFKLNTPNGGWKGKKSKHFVDGGESGDCEAQINSLVNRMN